MFSLQSYISSGVRKRICKAEKEGRDMEKVKSGVMARIFSCGIKPCVSVDLLGLLYTSVVKSLRFLCERFLIHPHICRIFFHIKRKEEKYGLSFSLSYKKDRVGRLISHPILLFFVQSFPMVKI